MKKFNVPNYVKYKDDVQQSIDRVVDNHQDEEPNQEWSRDELIIYFLPLVEEIARRFSTSDQASGVMDISDLIQDGSIGLIHAVDRIDWETVNISTDKLNTLRSFLSKRIKGAI